MNKKKLTVQFLCFLSQRIPSPKLQDKIDLILSCGFILTDKLNEDLEFIKQNKNFEEKIILSRGDKNVKFPAFLVDLANVQYQSPTQYIVYETNSREQFKKLKTEIPSWFEMLYCRNYFDLFFAYYTKLATRRPGSISDTTICEVIERDNLRDRIFRLSCMDFRFASSSGHRYDQEHFDFPIR